MFYNSIKTKLNMREQKFILPSRNNVLIPDTRGGAMRLLPSVRHGYKVGKTGLQNTLKQASSMMGSGLAEKLQRLQISKVNRGGNKARIIGMLR